MHVRGALPVVIVVAGLAVRGFLTHEPRPRQIAITHVNVIDGTGAPAESDMTIVIAGDRIVTVGKSGSVLVAADAQVVDAHGKYAIPGLWDMHVHIADQRAFLPLLIANGITGVRDMGGSLDILQDWRQAIASGTLLGPRIVAAGPFVDGPKTTWPDSIAVDSPDEGRAAVKHLKDQGADFVKVYSLLPRDAYLAIAAESRRQRIPFAGHVPLSVTAAEASDAGQLTVDHIPDILVSCSQEEAPIRERFRNASLSPQDLAAAYFQAQVRSIDTYDAEKAARLFQKFASNGTWHVPTLVVLRSRGEPARIPESRVGCVPAVIRQAWESPLRHPNRADLRIFQKALEMVGAMRSNGVRLLAGTDVPAPCVVAGFSLHDELRLLVRAGLSPIEALQTATRNPAEALGVLSSRGTLEAGKVADLVLLEANPLNDIANTSRISALVLRGQLIPKTSLEAMLNNRGRPPYRN